MISLCVCIRIKTLDSSLASDASSVVVAIAWIYAGGFASGHTLEACPILPHFLHLIMRMLREEEEDVEDCLDLSSLLFDVCAGWYFLGRRQGHGLPP
jgi:hypothetical protein